MVLVASLLLACAACSSGAGVTAEHATRASGHLAQVATPENAVVPPAIEHLVFQNSQGRRVSLASMTGKTIVISDSMTLCSEDCPLDTANVVTAARRADAAGLTRRVEFLTVTVDPARDTPRRLRAFRAFYTAAHSLPNWQLLTGSRQNLARLWKYFGVYWKRVPEDTPPDRDWMTGKPLAYDIEHSDEVFVVDPHAHERYVISGHAHVPDAGTVPGRLQAFLSAEGKRHLTRPGADTWTPADVTAVLGKLTGRRIPGTT